MVVHPWNPRAQDDWESEASMGYIVNHMRGKVEEEEKEREETGDIRTIISLQNQVRIGVVPTATSLNSVP